MTPLSVSTPLRVELRRNAGPIMFTLAVPLQLLAAIDWVHLGAAVWVDTSSALAMSSVLAGPVLASIAAWSGTREKRAHTAHLRQGGARIAYAAPAIELLSLLV